MARAAEFAGLVVVTAVLLTFFLRAWANLRRGRQFDREVRRLRAELDEQPRKDS